MALNTSTRYYVTNGALKGKALRPDRVSKCGNYGWFTYGQCGIADKRIHTSHLSEKEPERTIAVTTNVDKDAMGELHGVAHGYVTSENMKRIEELKSRLNERTAVNMAEVRAITEGCEVERGAGWTEIFMLIVITDLAGVGALSIGAKLASMF